MDGVGWLMATYMYDIVKEKHKGMLAVANYIALTADETSKVDNSSYIICTCLFALELGANSIDIVLIKIGAK